MQTKLLLTCIVNHRSGLWACADSGSKKGQLLAVCKSVAVGESKHAGMVFDHGTGCMVRHVSIWAFSCVATSGVLITASASPS